MKLKYVNGKEMKTNVNNLDDEYYTKPKIARHCFNKTLEAISKYDNTKKYTWLEPSAGLCGFYNCLPKNKRIGIDINPINKLIIKKNYLKYKLPDKPIVVIGNPPFGHRGVLALEFLNHSKSAEYVAFILPMFFMSVGKGSIRYRVKGFNMIYEEILPDNSFYLKNNKEVTIKCCFQVWSKYHKNKKKEYNWYTNRKGVPFTDVVDVKTVSLAKKRECGFEWIYNKKADFYISSTFFRDNKVVFDFKDVKYKSGIAIILKTNNKILCHKIKKAMVNADWKKYSSKATNGCYHIGRSHVYSLLRDTIGDRYE